MFPSNLLTKEDAIAVDWAKHLEVTRKEFLSKKAELEKIFKGNLKSTDVIWGLFNERITKTTDYHSLKMIFGYAFQNESRTLNIEQIAQPTYRPNSSRDAKETV